MAENNVLHFMSVVLHRETLKLNSSAVFVACRCRIDGRERELSCTFREENVDRFGTQNRVSEGIQVNFDMIVCRTVSEVLNAEFFIDVVFITTKNGGFERQS